MWSRVGRSPYLSTASLAALYPPPYAGEASWEICCMKNLPNLFSTPDLPPFFEDVVEDDDDEAYDVDGMFFESGKTSDSSHMYEST